MYSLTECSSSYSDTTGSLWFNSKYEDSKFNADISNNNAFKSFENEAKLSDNTILKNATMAVPLKYLTNFWRSLEMQLMNCKL